MTQSCWEGLGADEMLRLTAIERNAQVMQILLLEEKSRHLTWCIALSRTALTQRIRTERM